MITEFYYCVLDYCEDTRRLVELEKHESVSKLGHMEAELAAADYHYNDLYGWEATWPLTFILYETETGPEAGRFFVDREVCPSFCARKVKT